MSARRNVNVVRMVPADGGDSPNATIGAITFDVRIFAPPGTPFATIEAVLDDGFDEMWAGIRKQWPNE